MELKPPINLHQRRVLIVDDDGDTTDLLTYAPERCGAIVAAATAIRERTGTRPHPFDRALAEPYLALARADRNAWDSGWQAGTGMSLHDVVELAAGA